jgi:hypothetical protein
MALGNRRLVNEALSGTTKITLRQIIFQPLRVRACHIMLKKG